MTPLKESINNRYGIAGAVATVVGALIFAFVKSTKAAAPAETAETPADIPLNTLSTEVLIELYLERDRKDSTIIEVLQSRANGDLSIADNRMAKEALESFARIDDQLAKVVPPSSPSCAPQLRAGKNTFLNNQTTTTLVARYNDPRRNAERARILTILRFRAARDQSIPDNKAAKEALNKIEAGQKP